MLAQLHHCGTLSSKTIRHQLRDHEFGHNFEIRIQGQDYKFQRAGGTLELHREVVTGFRRAPGPPAAAAALWGEPAAPCYRVQGSH